MNNRDRYIRQLFISIRSVDKIYYIQIHNLQNYQSFRDYFKISKMLQFYNTIYIQILQMYILQTYRISYTNQ
jgi:hypothetical protein